MRTPVVTAGGFFVVSVCVCGPTATVDIGEKTFIAIGGKREEEKSSVRKILPPVWFLTAFFALVWGEGGDWRVRLFRAEIIAWGEIKEKSWASWKSSFLEHRSVMV